LYAYIQASTGTDTRGRQVTKKVDYEKDIMSIIRQLKRVLIRNKINLLTVERDVPTNDYFITIKTKTD